MAVIRRTYPDNSLGAAIIATIFHKAYRILTIINADITVFAQEDCFSGLTTIKTIHNITEAEQII